MAVDVFHTDARGFGLLSSISGRRHLVRIVACGQTGSDHDKELFSSAPPSSASAFVLAAFAPGYWWFAAALVVIGAAGLTFTNSTNSLMQLSTEPTMRGRVMALRVGVALGGTPIGAPTVGWVASHFGPRWALGIGAAAGLSAALVALLLTSPSGRTLDRLTTCGVEATQGRWSCFDSRTLLRCFPPRRTRASTRHSVATGSHKA